MPRRLFRACLPLAMIFGLGACAWFSGSSGAPEMPSSMKNQQEQVQGFSDSTALVGPRGPRASINGEKVSSVKANTVDQGFVLPDGAGGVVWVPGAKREEMSPSYVDARELKLKVRELAEQLISGLGDNSLRNAVALPVSFVNMDNFEESSTFGRFLAEQLFYEFNQRGFPVREYRNAGVITMREGDGEFYLSRSAGEVPVGKGNLVVAGTYYGDKQSIFVNARLLCPGDGRVLRTAQLVLKANNLTRRMLANTGRKLEGGSLTIRDLSSTRQDAVPKTPFDEGQDIH